MSVAIAIIAIFVLVVLHELGHFLTAKKFGIMVEEFGVGLPPRVFGKKFGETMYSLNLLPIGAFVRMRGEESEDSDPRSFGQKPIWQRILVVLAGVISSWLAAIAILTVLIGSSGIPVAFSDDSELSITNPQVRISGVVLDSPAQIAGINVGDTIVKMQHGEETLENITTVEAVQAFTDANKGKTVSLVLDRVGKTVELDVIPRENPPAGQGPIGVSLIRSGLLVYPWYEAPVQGAIMTGRLTVTIVQGFGGLIGNLLGGDGLPSGVQIAGPVGVIDILQGSLNLGVSYFLYFIALIAIYLAIFNTVPIPALDGGRLLFLVIEGMRGNPLPEKLVQRLIFGSFAILIPLILWVTLNDIRRIF